jgi:hypothetical protein
MVGVVFDHPSNSHIAAFPNALAMGHHIELPQSMEQVSGSSETRVRGERILE